MTNRADADFLQVLRREAWQDLFANLVLALVLPKTEAPQPEPPRPAREGANTSVDAYRAASGERARTRQRCRRAASGPHPDLL